VLFVNSIGLRNPAYSSAKDLKRIVSKLAGFVRGVEQVGKNLFVLTPLAIPIQNNRIVKVVNRWLLYVQLRFVQLSFSLKDPFVFVFSPIFSAVADKLHHRCLVYYCIDDLAWYKGVNKDDFERNESVLVAKADAIIACSRKLFDAKKPEKEMTFYVPHGVDWNNFSAALAVGFEKPGDIKDIPGRLIGYYGFISEDWIDYDLINAIGDAGNDWSVVLIGRVKEDIKQKIKSSNVYFLGVKDFHSLPRYNRFFSAAIIPFKLNELTLSSNPLKLYEYLSSGLPVVSIDIPEVRRCSSLISIAVSKEDFINKLRLEIAADSVERRQERAAAMKSEDWSNRLDDISRIIQDVAKGRK